MNISESLCERENLVAIVLEYRRPDCTSRCLQSLVDAGVQHILVWDNSEDQGKSVRMLEQKFEQYVSANRIKFAGRDANLGFGRGVNAAIDSLDTRDGLHYVLLINNDATINTQGVDGLIRAMRENPSAALAAPRYLNSETKETAKLFYNRFFATIDHKRHFGSFEFLSGCCLLIDLKKAKSPVFDERFFMYGEDVALSCRLQSEGHQLAVTESASVEHASATSSVKGSLFYEYHVVRGHLLLTSRMANSSLLSALLWPTRLASLGARSLVRTIRSKSFTPMLALWRALFGIGIN